MKRFGVLATGCLLASCASVGELRERPPIVDVQTDKAANQVAGCVSEKWSRQKGSTVNTMVIKNGIVVSIGWFYYSTPVTEMVLEVTEEGPRRRVKLMSRDKRTKEKSIKAYREMLAACF